MHLPQQVIIREVGPRDGLQLEKEFIPTVRKLGLIRRLVEAGIRFIEVTSFVNPRLVPQMADAEQVMQGLAAGSGITYSALILNERGMKRAIEAGVREIQAVISASEEHNQKNTGMSIADSLSQIEKTTVLGQENGVTVRAAIAVAFGCPFSGMVREEQVFSLVGKLVEIGIRSVTLADTVGVANPRQVYDMMQKLKEKYPAVEWCLHLHDTRGMGLANVLAGLQTGVVMYEASIGGLGGCPVITDAPGNIATEDLVYMLEEMGIDTGINLRELIRAVRFAEEMVGRRVGSRLSSLG
ncbi:hydroxymethylglutaryl-CoA lyase [Calderihabitans maritimus]|uniref:Pyruvate carboxyltransferase n=1 Tax=Calderihabitans maritimus TaxID=1246530 RepID=A0A1Z5HWZ6_9FIRM|nr:hydroxymethylglutaryl-CoA lyase [Calderihabitans maritimus]GAW93938.1 pyruvate carboxyltransferase [Calderihabitans maritimus]